MDLHQFSYKKFSNEEVKGYTYPFEAGSKQPENNSQTLIEGGYWANILKKTNN